MRLSRFAKLLLLWMLGLLAGARTFGGAIAAETGRHPQDGPHVDLRFELRSDAVVADVSMNLVFLDEILPPEREQPDRLELSELRAIEDRLRARMAEVCVVAVDGRVANPAIEALAMNDPDEALLPLFPVSGMRGLRKIRFELVHAIDPGKPVPDTISFIWKAYPTDLLSIAVPRPKLTIAAELVAQGVRNQITFTEFEPEHVWHAEAGGIDARLTAVPKPVAPRSRIARAVWIGALGVVGLALVFGPSRRERRRGIGRTIGFLLTVGAIGLIGRSGAGDALPNDVEAKAIFEGLHTNLYRAFDYAEESAIYDALSRSVDGPLLEQLYLTIHRSLVMQEEGGAVSRVRAVRRDQVAIELVGMVEASIGHGLKDGPAKERGEIPSFVVRCRYEVDGRVTHWGHSHDRTYAYEARYTIAAREVGWRIAEAEILSQTRTDLPAGPSEPSPAETRPDGLLDL